MDDSTIGMKHWIRNSRKFIRNHRDARGDDRCWVTDYQVWSLLGSRAPKLVRPTAAEAIKRCEVFYRNRCSDRIEEQSKDAIVDPALWDSDLDRMSVVMVFFEVLMIQQAVSVHLKVPDSRRTWRDDQALYSVLPERIPADFRLPPHEEFLGRAKADAGCPNFWDSHAGCKQECNLHEWGPC